MMEQVWVLVIKHKHGVDAFAFREEKDLERFLLEWAQDWWEDEFGPDDVMPDDHVELIDMYFGRMEDRGETYSTHLVELQ